MNEFNIDKTCESIKPYVSNDFYRTYMYYIITKYYGDENMDKIVENNDVKKLQNIAETYDDKYKMMYKKSDMIATWKDWSTNLFISNVMNNMTYIQNIDGTPIEKFQYFNSKFFTGTNVDKKTVDKFIDTILCENTKTLDDNYENSFLK